MEKLFTGVNYIGLGMIQEVTNKLSEKLSGYILKVSIEHFENGTNKLLLECPKLEQILTTSEIFDSSYEDSILEVKTKNSIYKIRILK